MSTYFTVDPEEQRTAAEEKVEISLEILRSAIQAYEKDGTRVNRIALKAAERLVRETRAQWEEWTR